MTYIARHQFRFASGLLGIAGLAACAAAGSARRSRRTQAGSRRAVGWTRGGSFGTIE